MELSLYKHEYFDGVYNLLCQLWPSKILNKSDCFEVLDRGLHSNNQVYTCAFVDNKLAGFCSLTITNSLLVCGSLGYVDELVIDENFRGQGIGQALLTNIEEIAISKACKGIELISAFHREKAHRFYEKNKFVKTAFLFEKKL